MLENLTGLLVFLGSPQPPTWLWLSIRTLSQDRGWCWAMVRTAIHGAMKQHCSSSSRACMWWCAVGVRWLFFLLIWFQFSPFPQFTRALRTMLYNLLKIRNCLMANTWGNIWLDLNLILSAHSWNIHSIIRSLLKSTRRSWQGTSVG